VAAGEACRGAWADGLPEDARVAGAEAVDAAAVDLGAGPGLTGPGLTADDGAACGTGGTFLALEALAGCTTGLMLVTGARSASSCAWRSARRDGSGLGCAGAASTSSL
jgi:hypothetical protein